MLLIKLFFFASIISVFECASSFDTEERSDEIPLENIESPFYPRNVGIVNTASNCYMSALFSSLYSVPALHNEVLKIASTELEKKSFNTPWDESLIVGLARVFAKMRLSKKGRSVSLKRRMFYTISKLMDWYIGSYECVFEFWDRFLENLPSNHLECFKELFEVEKRINYIDEGVEKGFIEKLNYLTVTAPNSENESLSNIMTLLTDQHLSKNGSNQLDTKYEISSSAISNLSSVLILRLNRIDFDSEAKLSTFNSIPIDLTDITINDSIYIPMAFILFDTEEKHYYAITFDLEIGKYYVHNDKIVEEIVFVEKEEKEEEEEDDDDDDLTDKAGTKNFTIDNESEQTSTSEESQCIPQEIKITKSYFENEINSNSVMIFYAKKSNLKSLIENTKEAVKENLDIPKEFFNTISSTRSLKRKAEVLDEVGN